MTRLPIILESGGSARWVSPKKIAKSEYEKVASVQAYAVSMSASEAVAIASAGVMAGCLTFGSFVDTRAINLLVDAGEEATVRRFFQTWWPCGRDLMVPMILITSGSHAVAFAATRNPGWLATAGAIISIGPYTALVLGEDIAALRAAETSEVATTARRFCRLHHPRTVMAGAVLAASVSLLLRAARGRA